MTSGEPSPTLNHDADAHVRACMNDATPTFDLVAYAQGTVDVAMQHDVEAHISRCLTCATTVDELRAITLLLHIAALEPEA